jgi:hypothetical protein
MNPTRVIITVVDALLQHRRYVLMEAASLPLPAADGQAGPLNGHGTRAGSRAGAGYLLRLGAGQARQRPATATLAARIVIDLARLYSLRVS